ncbi:methyltransferase domain-containing protein [Hyphomicrobium sp. DY-1]|uniref:class I SAM-dependent methyltransferase n=1 Tax=Hyphomicrobium sp. DY-1 TaxID=3075650 RepID=UPI0039C0E074
MAHQQVKEPEEDTWSKLGSAAVDRGDFKAAKTYFQSAVDLAPRSALGRYHLALVMEALGDFGGAGEQLTEALRLQPAMIEAARHLGALVTRRSLPGTVKLNRFGVQAALKFDLVNRDQIAEAFIYSMARGDPLKPSLDLGRSQGWLVAARDLCLKRTSPLLADNLFRTALRDNIIRMPELECLLIALRRTLLLEVPESRFQDRTLSSFVITLAEQCWINEYVWATSDDEECALRERFSGIDFTSGDVSSGIKLGIAATYAPVSTWLGEGIDEVSVRRVKPNIVRDFALDRLREDKLERSHSANVPKIAAVANANANATSQAVRDQYESAPYPRWTSLGVLTNKAEWQGTLRQFFDRDRLKFLDEPFELLIAGCGTGLQALAAATVYGPNARVTAIDISRASLGYASRMAERLSIPNVQFLQADILDLENTAEFKERFDVIECVGVLHHMQDPFRGWTILKTCLSSSGIMLIGLYSRIARRYLAELKNAEDYPGPNCSNRELRNYRQSLVKRPDGKLRDEYFGIRDLYSTSAFRDLFLHVSERNHSLPEIATFMSSNGLNFRGFMNVQDFVKLKEVLPLVEWPGKLKQWAELEKRNPNLFGDMYRFWCDKSSTHAA